MGGEHLVDPELKPVLAFFPVMNFDAQPLDRARAEVEAQFRAIPTPDLPVTVERIEIEGPANAPLAMLSYRPSDATGVLPCILQIHGGGFVLGTAEMSDALNRMLAAELQCAIVAVDYRLAPETRHPGPVEDCYAALKWIHANAAQLGIDPARIGVKGESAGGGLAASLAMLVRDGGEFSLAFQHLIAPMIDDRTCTKPDPHPFTGEFVWTRAHNQFGWSSLLGAAPGGAEISPYAAAARAVDLAGLPPAFIIVGALDLFLEENIDYARRLTRAGVPVELHVYAGGFHGFDMIPTAEVSMRAMRESRDALRRAMFA